MYSLEGCSCLLMGLLYFICSHGEVNCPPHPGHCNSQSLQTPEVKGGKAHFDTHQRRAQITGLLPCVKHLFSMSQLKVQTSVNKKPICAHNLMNQYIEGAEEQRIAIRVTAHVVRDGFFFFSFSLGSTFSVGSENPCSPHTITGGIFYGQQSSVLCPHMVKSLTIFSASRCCESALLSSCPQTLFYKMKKQQCLTPQSIASSKQQLTMSLLNAVILLTVSVQQRSSTMKTPRQEVNLGQVSPNLSFSFISIFFFSHFLEMGERGGGGKQQDFREQEKP